MNGTPYIFGNLKDGFCQYPDDYTSDIFTEMFSQAASEQQLVIHRCDNLIYYTFISRLTPSGDSDTFFGLCMMLNGEMVSNVKELYPLFEDIFNQIVYDDRILHRSKNGYIVPLIGSMTEKQKETDSILKSITDSFSSQALNLLPLPASRHTEALHVSKSFIINDDNDLIVRSTVENEYTFIYKYKNGFQYSAFSRLRNGQLKRRRRLHEAICLIVAFLLIIGMVITSRLLDEDKENHQQPASGQSVQKSKKKNDVTVQVTTSGTCLYLYPNKNSGVLMDHDTTPLLLDSGTTLNYCCTIGDFHEVIYRKHRAYIEKSRCQLHE